MKKLFSVAAIALALTFTGSTVQQSVFAAEKPKYKVGDIVQVGQYKGVIISEKDLPKNITPRKVNSMEEAAELTKEMDNSMSDLTIIDATDTKVKPFSSVMRAAGVQNGRQDKKNGGPQPGTDFHVVANYTYEYNYYGNSFISINSISSYLSGYTATIGWSQTDSNFYIHSENASILDTTVYGRLTNYLITPVGLVATNSSNKTVKTQFRL